MRIIIAGATGMVGKGILLECLKDDRIKEVVSIGRRSLGMHHNKLKEIIHSDFFDIVPIAEQLAGFDAFYFSIGVSAAGKNEETYTKYTYTMTMHVAQTIVDQNPKMTFIYVSGLGTDSSEKGNMMWARVKGKTENDLMKLRFKDVYAFRPGFIEPKNGIKSSTRAYNIGITILRPIIPLIHWLAPKHITTTTKIGNAAIEVSIDGYEQKHLYNKDFNRF